MLYPLEQFDLDTVYAVDRLQPLSVGVPDEGVSGIQDICLGSIWGDAFKGIRNAGEDVDQLIIIHKNLESGSALKGAGP